MMMDECLSCENYVFLLQKCHIKGHSKKTQHKLSTFDGFKHNLLQFGQNYLEPDHWYMEGGKFCIKGPSVRCKCSLGSIHCLMIFNVWHCKYT